MGPIWWQAVVAVAIIAVCAIAGVSGALSGGGSEGSVPMITLASEKLISVQGHASFNLTLSAPLGMLDVVNETVHFEFTVGDCLISESGKPAGGPCLVGLTSLANNYADSPNLNERGVLDAANETVFQHVAVDPGSYSVWAEAGPFPGYGETFNFTAEFTVDLLGVVAST